MLRYIGKRILLMPVMLVAITFIIFTLVNLVKVDPALIILGSEASMEDVAALNEEMGFNDPIIVRYGDYVADALHGDLGTSYYTKKPVVEEVMSRFPHTLKLTLLSIGAAIAVGLPLGILCAVKQYSLADNILSAGAMFIGAMPAFWLSLLLLLTFSLKLGWLPANGITGWKAFLPFLGWDFWCSTPSSRRMCRWSWDVFWCWRLCS